MTRKAPWERALGELVAELRALYGARLDRVVLYGSRARGDAADDSDVDVLVALRGMTDFWGELSRMAPIADRLSLEHEVVLALVPVDTQEFEHAHSPLLENVRAEGLTVG